MDAYQHEQQITEPPQSKNELYFIQFDNAECSRSHDRGANTAGHVTKCGNLAERKKRRKRKKKGEKRMSALGGFWAGKRTFIHSLIIH